MMKIPKFVQNYRRYYFPFLGAPCCEKMSLWLNVNIFCRFSHLFLAPKATQTDLLIIIGRISHKQAPVLQHFYNDMLIPNSVIHLKGCDTHAVGYASMKSLENLIPMHHSISKCPIEFAHMKAAIDKVKLQ